MESLSPRRWEFLETVARDVAPAVAQLDDDGWRQFRAIIDHALAQRPARVRGQFGTLLDVVRLAPLVRFAVPYNRLDAARRARLLQWFHTCPVGLLRKGFWGLKTLTFMGVYAQPATAPRIHYTPSFDGNAKLHA